MKNKNTRLFVILLVVVLIFSLIFRILTPVRKVPPQPNPNQPVWNNLKLNYTTEAEVIKKVGTPIAVSDTKMGKYLDYKSDYKTLPQQVLIKDGVVNLVKQRINVNDKTNFNPLISILGKEDSIQYTSSLGDAFPLYIYASQGIALAKNSYGNVFEIWYFSPMTLDEFMKTFGAENLTEANITSP